ncbi:hypothetical protein [Ralstonia solanacearum]|uniref:hypothetical protein n=1 Tax=Ralstonia solanacearum TaxID=305 RepID=UPI0012FD9AD5|nr:hypothetical protein [Ralstonia solanacearum]
MRIDLRIDLRIDTPQVACRASRETGRVDRVHDAPSAHRHFAHDMAIAARHRARIDDTAVSLRERRPAGIAPAPRRTRPGRVGIRAVLGKTLTQRLKHGRRAAIEELLYALHHRVFAATACRWKG